MTDGKKWTRDEILLAINLYCKTPFGKIHVRNPEIIHLAKILNRTPGSISYKLANFASIDPSLDRKGASNYSHLDKQVWDEFFSNWDELAYESEKQLAKLTGTTVDNIDEKVILIGKEGKTKEQLVQIRVNQNFFRKMVLSSYNYQCCISGLPIKELLVASHIVPWSVDTQNRLNPRNGLCLNALLDKAFDVGLISLSEDFTVLTSKKITDNTSKAIDAIRQYDGKTIAFPSRFLPSQEFLQYHRDNIFKNIA